MDLVEQIAERFAQTRKFLESIGVAPTTCTYRRESIQQAPLEAQRDALLWLIGYDIYIEEYKKATKLSPKLVQALYEIHGGTTYEQRQINIAKKLLLEQWRNRPIILRKHGVGKTGTRTKRKRKAKS